ncbi:hypothetical protein ACP275_11G099200 [Erythranthe tilingii]
MEIDFLGLNSPTFNTEQEISKDAFSDTDTCSGGGVETSLSLSTSTFQDNLNLNEKWEVGNDCKKMMITSSSDSSTSTLLPRPVFDPRITTTGFPFDLNQNSTDSRDISEIPETASLAIINPDNVFIDNLSSEKAKNTVLIAGKASLGFSNGYTPTVAMARRASLARFLEKRSHRMNEAKTTHIMGKSLKKGKTSIERS